MMVDSANASNVERKRVIRSCPNTREERLKQQKQWKKKREQERARARNAVTTLRQDGNADKGSNPANDERAQNETFFSFSTQTKFRFTN